MSSLKLAKLPDRTPVKVVISLSPELYRTLEKYAERYRATYGEAEKIIDLIPFIVEAFLASDKGFAKACKTGRSEQSGAGDTP